MERTLLKDLGKKIGEDVKIFGFIHAIRDQGGIKFLQLRDFSGIVQIVVLKSEKEVFDAVKDLSLESVLEIHGRVKEEKQAPGGFEVQAMEMKILSLAEPELPIPIVEEKGAEETELTKRLDWRWLDLRKVSKKHIFPVWTALEEGFRKYFLSNGFVQIYTPSLMNTASETGADVFEVKYFERKAYLAQSPQFYKQMAMSAGMERVFMVGPVFRAEPSFTTRHLTEFTGWDFEVSYINDHFDVMSMEEDMIISGFREVRERTGIELEIPSKPFPKIGLRDAKKILAEKGVKSEKPFDLSPEEERTLSEIFKEKEGSDFVFLTDYPVEVRPFYHMRYEDDPDTTKSFDLLYKGVEITTGAQREHRPEILKKQAIEKRMDLKTLEGYINFFRYGCPPHGGAGIGPGRIIMRMLDLPTVKEATFLPRDVKRLTP
ncbi:MAG: aspartate--tRNA(Asn) ligase [Patescibacteria group bacterium]|nr:MAG: aspartate--tRNA(Asn) ligase [Patescibacteria group bacterium]